MLAKKSDILTWVATRGVLKNLAQYLTHMEKDEAIRLLKILNGEINMLLAGNCKTTIWQQATASLNDLELYNLEKISFSPK